MNSTKSYVDLQRRLLPGNVANRQQSQKTTNSPPPPPSTPSDKMLAAMEKLGGKYQKRLFRKFTFALDNPGTSMLIQVPGTNILSQASGNGVVSVSLDQPQDTYIDLLPGQAIKGVSFSQFYVSNTGQAGLTATLIVWTDEPANRVEIG